MPICSQCRHGFESGLSRCPNCGAAYWGNRQGAGASVGSGWLWALGSLFFLGLVGSIVLGSAAPFGLSLCLAVLLLYIWSICWSYADAEARNKPGWAVALLVALLSWPIGLLIWFVFRP
jgi:hypothetical protein